MPMTARVACIFGLIGAAASAHGQTPVTRTQAEQLGAELRAHAVTRPGAGAVVEPSLTGGAVVTPAVTVTVAPGQARLQLTIDPGTVGAAAVGVEIASPSGASHFISAYYTLPYWLQHGRRVTYTVQVGGLGTGSGLDLYSEAGVWTVSTIYLGAVDGTSVTYDAGQIAALIAHPTVSVTNPGAPDVTPPALSHGVILTPVISLSGPTPYFAARVRARDGGSGVGVVTLSAYGPGNAAAIYASADILSPVNNGVVTISAPLLAGTTYPTGTYTIASYSACDLVPNCIYGNDPAAVQALFGTTTFQVTN